MHVIVNNKIVRKFFTFILKPGCTNNIILLLFCIDLNVTLNPRKYWTIYTLTFVNN